MKIRNVFFACMVLFTSGCGQSSNKEVVAVEGAKIFLNLTLDVPISSMVAQAPTSLPFEKSCVSGLCWYEINKSNNDNNLPTVAVGVGENKLQFDNVSGVVSTVDEQFGQNVQNLELTLRSLPDNSSHEKNKEFIYTIVRAIVSKSWQYYRYPESPRIPGSEAGKLPKAGFVMGVNVLSHPWFDPAVEISMAQWMSNTGFYDWDFYKDGVYLKLRAWRSNSDVSPELNGNYLVTVEFHDEQDFWVDNFKSEDMPNWVALLPSLLKKYHQQRQELEAKAKASGIKIDETYQDPPIKALGQ
jgi:hypothetical protein